MINDIDYIKIELRARLLGSLLFFCQTYFKILTGNDFIVSNPPGRESHMVSICRELTDVFEMKTNRLIINISFGHFKTTILSLFVAWCFSHYPDCQFIVISYSKDPATKATYLIKRIMELPEYRDLFDIRIRSDSKSKFNFMTTGGGIVRAFGSNGSVTGADAGRPGLKRFSGCAIYDDPHKGFSGSEDEGAPPPSVADIHLAIANFPSVVSRLRGENIPLIVSGQRVMECDLSGRLISGMDGEYWKKLILPSLDENRNPLFPEAFPLEKLEIWEKYSPNFFNAQCQQNPNALGGRLFRRSWLYVMDEDPENMIVTFLTVDTAESSKDIADDTVFSFWGYYKIKEEGTPTAQFGLHCIHSVFHRIEPYELKDSLLDFYGQCLRYKFPPKFIVIEKKSTGKTLWSVLDQIRGLEIRGVERTSASGSKSTRYNEMQHYISRKLVSFTELRKHTKPCIEHLIKITDNDSHAKDDFCDTLYDAIKIAFIDKTLYHEKDKEHQEIYKAMTDSYNYRRNIITNSNRSFLPKV